MIPILQSTLADVWFCLCKMHPWISRHGTAYRMCDRKRAKFLMDLSLVLPQLAVFLEIAFLQCPSDALLNFSVSCETLLTWTCNKLTTEWGKGLEGTLCILFLGSLLLLFFTAFCIKNKNICLPGILPHGKLCFSWWNQVVTEDTQYLSALFRTWLKLKEGISFTMFSN